MSAEAAPRTAKKKRARWAIIALVVVVVVVLAVAVPMVMGGGKESTAAAPVTTVATGELVVTASADGQTAADHTYDVYPDVSGTVDKLEVSLGDKVTAGDTLFTIDDASLQSAVRSANAQLSAAKSQVAQANQQVAQANQQLDQAEASQFKAENNLHSLQSLTGTAAVSSARIAEAKNDVAVAKAGVTTAKAGVASANSSLTSAKVARSNAEKGLADARSDLDKVTVTAPAGGVVTSVNVVDGGSVSTGGGATGTSSAAGATASMTGATTSASSGSSAPIVISDSSILIATVAVNEVDIADVKAGQEATVTFDAAAGLAIPAKVRWVSPNATTSGNVRTYDVELELAEQDAQLRPGMTASADIATLKLEATLLVPKTAVRVDGTSKFVTVVRGDGSQEKRTVTTGRSDELNVQVLSGLKAGEKILTSFAAPAEATRGGIMPGRPPAGMGGN